MKKLLINPFNPIGEFHNRGLDYLINNLTLYPATTNKTAYYIPEDDFPKIVDVTARFGSSDTLLAGCCRGCPYIDLYQSLAIFWNNYSGKVDSAVQYSSESQVNTWLGEIWQIPDGDIVSYEEKRRTLLDLEQRVLWDSGKLELKTVPLIGLAVAKSSLYYWYAVANSKFEQIPVSKPATGQPDSAEEPTKAEATGDQRLPNSLWRKLLNGWNMVKLRKGSTKNVLLDVFKEDTKGALDGAKDLFLLPLMGAAAITSPGLVAAICGTKAIVQSGSEVIGLASDAYKEIQLKVAEQAGN